MATKAQFDELLKKGVFVPGILKARGFYEAPFARITAMDGGKVVRVIGYSDDHARSHPLSVQCLDESGTIIHLPINEVGIISVEPKRKKKI